MYLVAKMVAIATYIHTESYTYTHYKTEKTIKLRNWQY